MYLMNNATKKTYVKADITLVDFSLSASIASSCVNIANIGSATTCTYTPTSGALAYFTGDIDQCQIKIKNEIDICYQVPTDDTKVFAS